MGPVKIDAMHVKSLAAELNSALQDPSTLDEAGRAAACKAAKRLTDALETPINAFLQQGVLVSLSEFMVFASSFLPSRLKSSGMPMR